MDFQDFNLDAVDLEQWRREMADYPGVLQALDVVEACEGDLEDAAIALAIQARLEPDYGDRWLASFAKRFRPLVCQPAFRSSLNPGDVLGLVRYLVAAETTCPELLALPVALAILQGGLEEFCQGFE
jgi:hypothetical protein